MKYKGCPSCHSNYVHPLWEDTDKDFLVIYCESCGTVDWMPLKEKKGLLKYIWDMALANDTLH